MFEPSTGDMKDLIRKEGWSMVLFWQMMLMLRSRFLKP